MAQGGMKVTQAGADPYRDVPGYEPVDGSYKGLTARDYASIPGTYVDYLTTPVEAAAQGLGLGVLGGLGGLIGGVAGGVGSLFTTDPNVSVSSGVQKGMEYGGRLAGTKEIDKFNQYYGLPLMRNIKNDPLYGTGTPGTSAATSAGGLADILAGYGAFNEAAERGADPLILQELADYNQFLAEIAPNVARGRAEIAGAYGQAAGAGRTAAGNIARRGEETALSAQDIYGAAAGEVSDLAQAGGTEVSGLTGPSQAFRSLYGDLYGTGEDLAYGTRGMSDLERQEMEAAALAAQRAGGRAARSFDELFTNISARDRRAIQSAIRMSQAQRSAAFDERKQEALGTAGGALTLAWRGGGDQKKRIQQFFPGVTNETELAFKVQEFINVHGPANTVTALKQVMPELFMGGTGG